ncbi:MAG: hypothetical protein F6J87_07140 [Spirulina sp. SIO3F2]|nr:hypothetical protein [Spirulina sp. SIO3F2]
MSYSQFTLDQVKAKFELTIQEDRPLFTEPPQVQPSQLLQQLLQDYLPLALAMNSEKARSEFIIAPILADVRHHVTQPISLFSGKEFNVDAEKNLTGFCDFLLSKSKEQLFIEAPVAIIVEAKNENIIGGLGQCAAAMIAAQIFNQNYGQVVPEIYGGVTTGNVWRFLRLIDHTLEIDSDEYYIKELPKILGILTLSFT